MRTKGGSPWFFAKLDFEIAVDQKLEPVTELLRGSRLRVPAGARETAVTGHLSDTDICPTQTFVRQPVRNFADICPTRTFVRQSHFKFILKTNSQVKGAILGDYR